MHIGYLSTMASYYGGEVCLASLAGGMQERGHQVTCIVRPESRLLVQLRAREIATLPLNLVDWYEPWGMVKLGRRLRQAGLDILHSHLPRDYFMAAMATLGTGICNVGTRHHLQRISHAPLKRPFLSRFAAMIAVSDAVRKGVLASNVMDEDLVVTVHNGIECRPPASRSASRQGRLRRSAGVAAESPVVGFVGRLCPTKGLEVLLRAASRLLPRWPELRVFILGDDPRSGNYLRQLEGLVAAMGLTRAVHFFGYVEDARNAAADFDVQVVCSHAEPFGLVTLEAMTQGCPVVVTSTGGSPEIVTDGVEGFLVDPGDAAALARKLDCLLDSPGLRREMGRRGRRRVAAEFSQETMLDRTEEIYRQVLVSHPCRVRSAPRHR